METAGRAVVFSGTTVAIGLLAMIVLPLPFLRSIGYAGMLIPLVSVIVATTLLPIVLVTAGNRLDWPHVRSDDQASRSGRAWARLVVRRRWFAAAGAAVVLAALVLAATGLKPGQANVDTLSQHGDARAALRALERSGIGAGALTPDRGPRAGGAGPARWRARWRAVPGVHGAVAPGGARGSATAPRCVDVLGVADSSTSAGRDTLDARADGGPAAGAGVRGGRHRRRERGLRRRHLRQLPADDRPDRACSPSSCWRGPSARCCCRSRRCCST